jgi:ApaG protein
MMAQEQAIYFKETQGIRISVRPFFLPEHSQPQEGRYVFAYLVRIVNASSKTVQLLSRHWYIYDAIGEEQEVTGDGVVGQQPVLAPGQMHDYQSFCVLRSALGHMEGSYRFIGRDDVLFDAAIPRFILDARQ